MIKRVGQFVINVWDPYPINITIQRSGQEDQELTFDHRDLRDLEYAVQAAIRAVNEKLEKVGDKPI